VNNEKKLDFAQLEQRRTEALRARGMVRNQLTCIVHNVRSAYNVGSIFRSADAFLLEQLILTGYTPCPPRTDVCKTALGAHETVPWRYNDSAVDAVQQLQSNGVTVLALELTTSSLPLESWHPIGPVALVLGNEISGVDPNVLEACNGSLEISMYGKKHSLNVAVAAGIAFHHAVQNLRSVDSQL